MPSIDELKNKYFVQSGDANPPSEPVPATYEGCLVTPLIDGEAYFDELATAFAAVGTGATPSDNAGHYIYIAGWWLHLLGGQVNPAPGSTGSVGPTLGMGSPFALDGPDGANRLIDLLKAKAKAGVDVRVLGWVSWATMTSAMAQNYAVSIRDVNVGTISAIHSLRQEPELADKCCLNILSHTAGAVHAKMVIVGIDATAMGFTGGIDFVANRHSDDLHTSGSWHDVQVKVEGAAVQALYDFFKQMWDEVIARPVGTFRVGSDDVPSVVSGTTQVPAKTVPAASVGTHHVQSLRTVPQFKYVWYNMLPEGDPISFAPDGLFEVNLAWRKAILAAEQYIYMEDQAFWSVEVMSWINQAIKNHPDLKVILVTGVPDPSDPTLPPFNVVALESGLLPGLTTTDIDRIRVYGRDVVVHSKTTLVDDHWAIIGSANCMRRSLYTDVEHSMAVIDELDQLVKEYRVNLWGGHFDLPPGGRSILNDLSQALNVWNSAWGAPGSGVTLPSHFGQVTLPPPTVTISDKDQEKYDRYLDPDSRQDWGGCLP